MSLLDQHICVSWLQSVVTFVVCWTCPLQIRYKCFQIIQAALQSQQHTPYEQQLLQTPTGRMLAGFLVSTCLAAAEAEVAAGPTGSKAVRQGAVQTLGAVVTALGSGPQLAFALPGLASGLAKQLLASGKVCHEAAIRAAGQVGICSRGWFLQTSDYAAARTAVGCHAFGEFVQQAWLHLTLELLPLMAYNS